MTLLVRAGLVELAVGALLGWAVVLATTNPDALRRIGIVHTRRVLQIHLDFIVMGLILVAVGLARPDTALWLALVLLAGTVVNPLLFLPLAVNERASESLAYRAVSALSFLAVSGGLVVVAVLP